MLRRVRETSKEPDSTRIRTAKGKIKENNSGTGFYHPEIRRNGIPLSLDDNHLPLLLNNVVPSFFYW
jgi:hypothetical protein